MDGKSQSLSLAQSFLNKTVFVTIDRPLGSKHPKWDFIYECNYGYINEVKAPDGEDLDAYVLKVDKPLEFFTGKVVAIVHRLKDDDDKLVIIPADKTITNKEIEKAVAFQEKWFEHEIIKETKNIALQK